MRSEEVPAPARVLLPSVAVTAVTWVLLALAQGIPTTCSLIAPCPSPDVRLAPALLYGGLMLVPLLAVAFVSQRPGRRGWLAAPAYIVLGVLALLSLGAVLYSGGFVLSFPW